MTRKASKLYKTYQNTCGPEISTVNRRILERDGLFFKDIDGTGNVTPVNDWRLPAEKRAAEYVKTLTVKEKIGQLFISDWRMGIHQPDESKRDPSGLLDEGIVIKGENIFAQQDLPSTSGAVKDWFTMPSLQRRKAFRSVTERAGNWRCSPTDLRSISRSFRAC